jgi:hypothetical protein
LSLLVLRKENTKDKCKTEKDQGFGDSGDRLGRELGRET